MNVKRTRICGPFSHNGCFTCKARRIKCDETQPHCLRCARSGRLCEGYRDVKSQSSHSSNREFGFRPNPTWALTTRCPRNEKQHDFAQLGIALLSFDSFRQFGHSSTIFDSLLPQLSQSIPSVLAAVTALGVAYDVKTACSTGPSVSEVYAASQYQIALRAIQHDLSRQPDGLIPLVLVCFVLGVAEFFLQQESNAIIHLRAAFKLLQDRRALIGSSYAAISTTVVDSLYSLEDHLEVILRTVDFHITSYALSKPPELPTTAVPLMLQSITNLGSAHAILVQLIHACYDFSCFVHKFRYSPHLANTSDHLQQGEYIAHLHTWLQNFQLTVLSKLYRDPLDPLQMRQLSHALTLRVTVLSILIHLSCALSPHETAFDAHQSHFRQIIADSEAIMWARGEGNNDHSQRKDGQNYTTGPGIIQPLFLTACKYRDPVHRRHAIRLLSIAGHEGPWSGAREACITSRIMDLEEHWHDSSTRTSMSSQSNLEAERNVGAVDTGGGLSVSSNSTNIESYQSDPVCRTSIPRDMRGTPIPDSSTTSLSATRQPAPIMKRAQPTTMTEIGERARIHTIGLQDEGRTTASGHPRKLAVSVRFMRSRDMTALLADRCIHEVQLGQNGSGLEAHSSGPCTEKAQWEIWSEVLEY